MQAIETFHRRTSTATDRPPEEHERRPLRKRLGDVLARCPEVVKKLVKKSSFIHHVGEARNYLTHYDPSLEESASRGVDLYLLTVQLQALVEMCLLLELAFACEEVDAFFDRVGRYREAQA